MREYIDREGVSWTAWGVVPGGGEAHLSEDLCRGWLCFQSAAGEKWRLFPIPARWEERSDAELDILRRASQPVNRRIAA
jgi:hypothetical protein